MSDALARIDVSCANGKTLAALSNLMRRRIEETGEAARESLAACAIQILVSLRAATKVAKPTAEEITLEDEAQLVPSYKAVRGKAKAIPCLRFRGSGARYETRRVIWAAKGKMEANGVFSFVDLHTEKKCYVVAPSADSARTAAQQAITKRANTRKGLAKLALGKLMHKTAITSQGNGGQAENAETRRISDTATYVQAASTGTGTGTGTATLTVYDNLRYALDALQGGQATVDVALQKAANKIAATINRQFAKDPFAEKIPTPFPDVRSRKQ